jgi:hypothetical protein
MQTHLYTNGFVLHIRLDGTFRHIPAGSGTFSNIFERSRATTRHIPAHFRALTWHIPAHCALITTSPHAGV